VTDLTGNISRVLGPHGITVNAVIPGATLTPAVERWMVELKNDRKWGDDFVENERRVSQEVKVQSVPRLGRPREIAASVCYLASPLAGYTNGTSIRVDGGAAHYF
jgi:3-oxoacyl-[acyl-carrier protein] reductase